MNLNGQPASFYQSATNLTSGMLADARLSSNVARLSATNTFAAEATFLTQIGIGATNSTAAQLWVQRADGGTSIVNANTVLGIESNATAYQQFFTPAASESGLLFGHTNPDPSIGAGFIYNNAAAPQGLQFRAGGNSTKMTLTSAGDLGIGTLAPTARLDVAGDMRVSGSVGIGTSTPEASLHVRSSDSLGTIIVTPGVTDTQSQLLLAENLSASNAMMARYNGSTNNLEIRGLAADVESPAHVTINRDSGAVAVHGDISIDPTTRYMSIPPAAFGAEINLHIFSFGIDNDALIPGTNGFAHAPVNLPHGAVVTAVEMYAVDTANTNATLELTRLGLNGAGGTTMASVSTSGTSGEQSPADTSIASATIDNSQYTYTLSVSWNQSSSGSVFFTGARIQYTVTSPLP